MMDKQRSFLEVVGTEKQMLGLIYSKGILHNDVLELYRRIRAGYEQSLLSSSRIAELQEGEYHLWKLHYQLIDEFRKRRQRSFSVECVKNASTPLDNASSQSDTDKGLEAFKLFLSEATEFYRGLILKLRTSSGLPSEILQDNKNRTSFPVESLKLQACQHTCHRLLICVGDLARYTEIVKKSDAWSTVARYYVEATRTWPDSGNPHNQLALLATYVSDPFLALYHCVRSLAVKEPFPDAWKNVMLLFEENIPAKLPAVSGQMQLDFLNPSKRSNTKSSALPNGEIEDLENISSEKFDLWHILVRTISFFFVNSSLEGFPSTLASAVNSIDAIFSVDDTKLNDVLESYEKMDPSRKGPYRAVQLVSIFIFVADSLTEGPVKEDSPRRGDKKRSESTPLAFAAIFICMGRLTERCLRGDNTCSCPLLPAVLVFVEWLLSAIDTVSAYDADEKVKSALLYFFVAFADLLDRIKQNWDGDGDGDALDCVALWEDHELRGFYPLIRVHERLDFASRLECMDNYECRNLCRFSRMFDAATRIVETAEGSCEWIPCDRVKRSLRVAEISVSDGSRNEEKWRRVNESVCSPKIVPSTDDEEVILFKPITRRNSAPLYISKPTSDPSSPEGEQTKASVADEWLRRATSLSTHQNNDDTESFSFYAATPNSGHSRVSKQKDSATLPRGPPSLSAWVLSNCASGPEQLPSAFGKQKLSPIDEISSTSFSDLTINEQKDSNAISGHASTIIHNTSPFMIPTPSAPLLPDDASWLRGNSLISTEYKIPTPGNEANGILGAAPAPISGYINRSRPPVTYTPALSGLVDGYPPLLGMSSSEWLYHYRNSQNMAGNHMPPIHFNPPAYGNYHHHVNEISSFDLCDQWGNHLVSNPIPYLGSPQMHPSPSPMYNNAEELKRDKFFLGYQRPFPYVCGVGMEVSSEQPSLLQYLKDKERQVQPGSQMRNPTYMGN